MSGAVPNYFDSPEDCRDPKRRSLSVSDWMNEFFNTTSKPVGHGFTQQMVKDGFACYSFHPRANIPIKVIVLDDTDKSAAVQQASRLKNATIGSCKSSMTARTQVSS